MVTTDDERLADRLRLLRNQGMRARYQYEIAGHNYRMTDLQAAVGIPQMERLDEVIGLRRRNAEVLSEGLADLDGLVTPKVVAGRTHVWHQYTVRVTRRGTDRSRRSRRAVGGGGDRERGLLPEGRLRLRLLPPRSEGGHRGDPPRPSRRPREVLSLPVHPHLTEHDLERIVTGVRSAFGR